MCACELLFCLEYSNKNFSRFFKIITLKMLNIRRYFIHIYRDYLEVLVDDRHEFY